MARKFLVAIDLGTNELMNAVIQNLPSASEPTGVKGRIYFDSTNNKLKVYDGTSWQNLSVSGNVALGTDTIGDYVESVADAGNDNLVVSGSGGEGANVTIDLHTTTVTAGNYGSATSIPTFTVDAYGRLTAAGEESVATTLAVNGDYGTENPISIDLLTDSLTIAGGEGIDVHVAGTTVTVSGEDASDTNKGIASFSSSDFSVTSGAVSIANVNLGTQTTGDYVATITGTDNEITVSGTGAGAAVTIGLPDDVTIGGDLTVTGDLTVNGTMTSLNTQTVLVEDNILTLNSNVTGTPSANAGIEVERGDSTNTAIIWNETNDLWTLTNDGTNYHSVARKYSETLSTSATSYTITHNLNTRDLTVQVYETFGPAYAQVEVDIEHATVNTTVVRFATAPTAGNYRVVIVG